MSGWGGWRFKLSWSRSDAGIKKDGDGNFGTVSIGPAV